MKKNKRLIIPLLLVGILVVIIGSTYAWLIWSSSEEDRTNITFTATGSFSCSATGVNTIDGGSISLVPTDCTKTENADHVIKKEISTLSKNNSSADAYLNMWLNVDGLGSYLANSDNFKYALTTTDNNCATDVVSTGNFKDLATGGRVNILESKKITSTENNTYYLWIWLDEAETTPPEVDETTRSFSLSLGGECTNQEVVDNFIVTNKEVNYQNVKLTANNTQRNIVSYAIVNDTPSDTDWVAIRDVRKTCTLNRVLSTAGEYKVWFKDVDGNTISDTINIANIDTTGPVCTFGSFSKTQIKNQETSTLSLTCTDPETKIKDINLTKESFAYDNKLITISNIARENVSNGYKYTLTITGKGLDGDTSISLPSGNIKNNGDMNSTETSSSTLVILNSTSLSNLTVTLSNDTYTYDGKSKTPEVVVKDGIKKLTLNKDYTIEYKDNINAGTGKVVITGKGNYSGSTTKTFTINKVTATCKINSVPTLKYPNSMSGNLTYNCTGTGNITVASGNTNVITASKTSDTVVSLTAKTIGTSKITISQAESTNYTSATISQDITASAEEYMINFDGNMFNGVNQTINGLTLTYDYENSYLTLNGTPTGNVTIPKYNNGLTFTEGDTYTYKATYVSGSYTNANNSVGSYVVDIHKDKPYWPDHEVSTRNNTDVLFGNILNGSSSAILTVNSAAASEGQRLDYWIWFDVPADWVFNNYKVKITFTKNATKKVSYGSTYGLLPFTYREGFTFDGWYTGENGTGTKINSSDTVSITNDTTLYAKWIDDIGPYGTANLSLSGTTYTVSLSDQGDDGSGLNTTYGFALTNGTCEAATYENQTGTSKTYSGTYTVGTTYYGCVKLTDKVGNISYIRSAGVGYNSTASTTYTTSNSYTYIVPSTGIYKLEAWGAQGGGTSSFPGGSGAYTAGNIILSKGEKLYIYVGENYNGYRETLSFNGGGSGSYGTTDSDNYNGGGASDIRYFGNYQPTSADLLWNSEIGLNSRIMTAGGGGGSTNYYNGIKGAAAGGLTGYSATYSSWKDTTIVVSMGGTQTSGGNAANNNAETPMAGMFGIGGYSTIYTSQWIYRAGGGGGYYGGGGGGNDDGVVSSAAGGSSYISGHTGCVAIKSSSDRTARTGTDDASCTTGTSDNLCSIHYSGKSFFNTIMIDGGGYTWTNTKGSLQQMPNPGGGSYTSGVGRTGNGAVRISYVSAASIKLTYNNNGGTGCTTKSVIAGEVYGDLCVPYREKYRFDGWYTTESGGTKILASTSVSNNSDHTIYAHWTKSINPIISFGTNGNSGYVKGNVSSKITVSRANANLDESTYKYIYSTSNSATPSTSFTSGNSYMLENATGTYYLIAKACDVDGKCTTEVSNPFYVDNEEPYGMVELSTNGLSISAQVEAIDDDSGINGYGYLIQKDNTTCPTSGYTSSNNTTYSFNVSASGKYTVCVKVMDNVGNFAYLKSDPFSYTLNSWSKEGAYTYVVPVTGKYKIELWGASPNNNYNQYTAARPAYGGYTAGNIILEKGTTLYFYVGSTSGTFNCCAKQGGDATSGGATDVRLVNGNWDNVDSLRSRIMVAGGGGASYGDNTAAGGSNAGGLSSYAVYHSSHPAYASTQTESGTAGLNGTKGGFGYGGTNSTSRYVSGAGGYYGGSSGPSGAGGSSFISGHTGCVAIVSSSSTSPRTGTNGASCTTGTSDNLCSVHYSGKAFTNTVMIDGGGYAWTNTKGSLKQMPNPSGGSYASGVGNSVDGAARITLLAATNINVTYNNNEGTGCNTKNVNVGAAYGELCVPMREGYRFDGWYTAIKGGTEITSSTIVSMTYDHTIYAHWTKSINPIISFGTNGNSGYVKGNVSSKITVSKGNANLDESTYKYIYSTSNSATPNTSFTSGNSYTLDGATGTYYLIARACDVDGKCTTEVSNPFYVDNTTPSGTVQLSLDGSVILANVSATDSGSGIKEYGYLIQKDNATCPTSGYVVSSNSNYTFNLSESGTYTVCVKLIDGVNNSVIVSNNIVALNVRLTYALISSNYSCSNSSVGSSSLFTYTGNCEIVDDSNGNWKIRFLTSGNLTFTRDVDIDVFLVGGGGSGSIVYGGGGGGGGSGYTKSASTSIVKNTSYSIVIGAGGAGLSETYGSSGNNGGASSAFNFSAAGGFGGSGYDGGAGGSGGGAGGFQQSAGAGGTNGGNGSGTTYVGLGSAVVGTAGSGQGVSTREFYEIDKNTSAKLYAGAGGGGACALNTTNVANVSAGAAGDSTAGKGTVCSFTGKTTGATAGATNTGGGGGGAATTSYYGRGTNNYVGSSGAGGSGIIIIRNSR